MTNLFVDNALCACQEEHLCASCRFCLMHNTPERRKALCEKISRFLVAEPIYQSAVARAMYTIFPENRVYDDEKDICRMVFEAALFEDDCAGITPFSYFLDHAPLSVDEKRLYEAWRTHTCHQFFVVEKVLPGKELHLTDLSGTHRYRIYEQKGTITLTEGIVIVARIVPFLKGWMFPTGIILSYGSALRETLRVLFGQKSLPQFTCIQHYHEYRKRHMAS